MLYVAIQYTKVYIISAQYPKLNIILSHASHYNHCIQHLILLTVTEAVKLISNHSPLLVCIFKVLCYRLFTNCYPLVFGHNN